MWLRIKENKKKGWDTGGLRSRDRRDETQKVVKKQKERCDTGGGGGAQGGEVSCTEPRGAGICM